MTIVAALAAGLPADAAPPRVTLACEAGPAPAAIADRLCAAVAAAVAARHAVTTGPAGAEPAALTLRILAARPTTLSARLAWSLPGGAASGPTVETVVVDRATLPDRALDDLARTLVRLSDLPLPRRPGAP